MPIRTFEQLESWKQGLLLTKAIYILTHRYPTDEKFSLVSQMRRAAISIPANISEGFYRRTSKDKVHFYTIAQGSLGELENYIILSHELKYLSQEHVQDLRQRCIHIRKLIHGSQKALHPKS